MSSTRLRTIAFDGPQEPSLCLLQVVAIVVHQSICAISDDMYRRTTQRVQSTLDSPMRAKRGGARAGAGPKPKGRRAGGSRLKRAKLASRHAVHVTVRLKNGLPNLRRKSSFRVLRHAFAAGCDRFGFRLVHYSIQNDHLHFIAEAKDRRSLSRGMQGLLVRVAKGLNKLWHRHGKVFADRYHDRILRTPREVRNALSYVLHNARKHGRRLTWLIDLFASGIWFDGWKDVLIHRRLAAPASRKDALVMQVGASSKRRASELAQREQLEA